MIDMDWIFRRNNMTFFFKILAETPNEHVLTTDQIKFVIEEVWKVYFKMIFRYLFIPFIIYLVCNTAFFTF